MSEELQQKLRDQLWEVANKLRGNMSASDFMYFTLGFIFYKYLSEKIEKHANDALVDDDRDNFMARKQKADGTSDLEERLNNYIVTERNNAVNTLAKDEDLDASVLNHYLSEYDYLQKEQPEIIQEALKEKHLGLIKKRKALTRILDKLRSIIRTFSWE